MHNDSLMFPQLCKKEATEGSNPMDHWKCGLPSLSCLIVLTLIPDFEKGGEDCAGNPLHDLKSGQRKIKLATKYYK